MRNRLTWPWRLISLATIGAGLAIGFFLVFPHRPADRIEAINWVADRHPGVPRLTPEALAGLPAGSVLLVDVRPVAEWSVSHLPGAFRSEDANEVWAEARRRHLDRVIVYCSIGERSSRLAEQVQARTDVLLIYNLVGGIFAWASENRPIEDADGKPTRLVHPYDATWGALLPPDRRGPLPGRTP
jgi:rhodanese-related sulfurtransferase